MTPELKEKLLRYANEKEPFTAHNHIRVCDIDEGSSRLELDLHGAEPEPLGPAPRRGAVYPGGRCLRPGAVGSAAGDLRHRQLPALTSWPLPGRPGAS